MSESLTQNVWMVDSGSTNTQVQRRPCPQAGGSSTYCRSSLLSQS